MTVTELLLRHDFVAFSARLHLIIDGHLLPASLTLFGQTTSQGIGTDDPRDPYPSGP